MFFNIYMPVLDEFRETPIRDNPEPSLSRNASEGATTRQRVQNGQ